MNVIFQLFHFAKKLQISYCFMFYINKLLIITIDLTLNIFNFAAHFYKFNRAQQYYNRCIKGYIRFYNKYDLAHWSNNIVEIGLVFL